METASSIGTAPDLVPEPESSAADASPDKSLRLLKYSVREHARSSRKGGARSGPGSRP
jgi:hypothetical protein